MKKKILSFSLVISILFGIFFQCLSTVCVCALSLGGLQSTIASIIISLMLECGVAPVNNAWIQTLNNSYGVTSSIGTIQDCIESGLLTETASGLVDSGLSNAIESASAYTDLGLSEIFTTSVDDVASGVIAGSGAANITSCAINVGTLGTIGAFAGAATIGVGLGVLANKIYDLYRSNIKYGLPINYNRIITESYLGGDLGVIETRINYAPHYITVSADEEDNLYFVGVQNNNYINFQGIVLDKLTGYQYRDYDSNGNLTFDRYYTTNYTNPGTKFQVGNIYMPNFISSNFKQVMSNDELDNIINSIKNGTFVKPDVYSPDLIGSEGNIKNDDSISSVVPDGYDMTPVDINDYMNFADNANDNTENDNVGQPIQGETFDNLIDSLLVSPSIIPDQGVTDPEVPDRPIIPDQPVLPGKDPITGEQQSEVLEGITTPDLRSVFPFCIPFDLYSILGVMKYEGREAPVIVWEFEFLGNSYPVIIDLSPYNDVAAILRMLELLLFIVGLAVETRKLIGAGG